MQNLTFEHGEQILHKKIQFKCKTRILPFTAPRGRFFQNFIKYFKTLVSCFSSKLTYSKTNFTAENFCSNSQLALLLGRSHFSKQV